MEGMNEDQIWAQLELRAANVCEILEFALETTGPSPESDEEGEGPSKSGKGEEDGDVDIDMDDIDAMEDSEEDSEEDDEESDEEEEEEEENDEDDGVDEDLGEGVADLKSPLDDESSDLELDKPSAHSAGKRAARAKPKKGGHPVLDDGFFDLAAFNAETEEAEARAVSKGRLARDSDDEDEDMEEEVDYFAAVDDEAPEEDLGETPGMITGFLHDVQSSFTVSLCVQSYSTRISSNLPQKSPQNLNPPPSLPQLVESASTKKFASKPSRQRERISRFRQCTYQKKKKTTTRKMRMRTRNTKTMRTRKTMMRTTTTTTRKRTV